MKWIVVLFAFSLASCSADNHSFVVDAEKSSKGIAKAIVTISDEKPKMLDRIGQHFVGRVIAGCEGSGSIRLMTTDGSTIDCPVGYLTALDDWWVFEVRGTSCSADSKSEPYVN